MADPRALPAGFERRNLPPGFGEKRVISPGEAAVRKARGGSLPQYQNEYGIIDELLPFTDEANAALQAGIDYAKSGANVPFGELYAGHKELIGGQQNKFREEHPYQSLGAAFFGGATLPVGKPAKAATATYAVLKGAGAGAVWGALFGFGEGSGVGERMRNTAVGGGMGLGIGGAIPLLFRGGGLIVRSLMGRGATVPKAQIRAAQMLRQALSDDGLNAADIRAMTTGGKPLLWADLGPKTKALLGSAHRMAGGGKGSLEDFLNNRTKGQFGRLSDDVAAALGVDPKDFARVGGEIFGRRKKQAKGNYLKAYAQDLDVMTDYRVKTIIDKPFGREALRNAGRMAEDAGESIRDDKGHYTVKAIDFMKRWMDDKIDVAFRAGRGQQATLWKEIRAEMLSAVDSQSPDFAAARASYAGDSSLLNALKDGRKYMRGDSEEIASTFASLNKTEQEMFRLGVARELREAMGRTPDMGDAARIFKTPNQRERLRGIFTDQKTFNKFMSRVDDEIKMQDTRNSVLSGSQTAPRLADDQSFIAGPVGEAAETAADVARYGTWRGLTTTAVRTASNARQRLLTGINKHVSDAIIEQTVDPSRGLRSSILAPGIPPDTGVAVRSMIQPATRDMPEAAPASQLPEGFSRKPPQASADPAAPALAPRMMSNPLLKALDPRTSPRDARFSKLQRGFGSRLTVNSAERTQAENDAIEGAAPRSRHLAEFGGDALDIDTSGMSIPNRQKLFREASRAGYTGISIYRTHIHVDGGKRRTWGDTPKWASALMRNHLAGRYSKETTNGR